MNRRQQLNLGEKTDGFFANIVPDTAYMPSVIHK